MNTEDEDALAALREFGFAETSKNKGSVGGARPIPRSDDRRTTIGSGLTPEQRTIRARVGAYALHAQGGTSTKAGTAAFMARFERQVDPDGVLPPDERVRRAAYARKAYFTRLALLSSRKRSPSVHRP